MMKSERIAQLERYVSAAEARDLAMISLIRSVIATLSMHHPDGPKAGFQSFQRGALNALEDVTKSAYSLEKQAALKLEAQALTRQWLEVDPMGSQVAPMQ